jgi:mono/diheme cytochrome c family protein
MPGRSLVLRLATTASALAGGAILASEPIGEAFFEQRIRPLLAEKCYSCHSARAEKLKGGLRLDTRTGLAKGGEGGSVLVPGQPEQSRLIAAVRRSDPDTAMPPKAEHSLTKDQVADLVAWVQAGAIDPRSDELPAGTSSSSRHWAFQPVASVTPPEGSDANPIDRFVRAKLRANRLDMSPEADRRTWLRRVTFDLIGLPPTPQEMAAFLADTAPDAKARVADRLLASRHHGEKWGRLWLDVVRYADTSGCNSDYPVPTAYLYRNWVIDSLNADKPYDQFLREQLAGDLLAQDRVTSDDDAPDSKLIIATGYLAISRRFGSRASEFHLTLEDTIDNVGKAMLGLSVNCARCHDHKFDPISTRDYYAWYGIFGSTRYAFPGTEIYQHPKDYVPLASRKASEAYRLDAEAMGYLDDLVEKLKERKKGLERATNLVAAAGNNVTGSQPAAATDEISALERTGRDRLPKLLAGLIRPAPKDRNVERKDLIKIPDEWTIADVKGALYDAQAEQRRLERKVFDPALTKAYAVGDLPRPANARIQRKGDPNQLGDEVPRGFLTVLGGQTISADSKESGRRELAAWITDPANPLTARVMVNRIWRGHFGRGLVATENDFGVRGQPPTHPELLDWLTGEFVRSGWSLKHLHRLIVLSDAYGQSSASASRKTGKTRPAVEAAVVDPNNTLLSHFPRRRLTAEEVRDALLSVGGGLDLSPGGPHPFPPERDWTYTQHLPFVADYPSDHRSVYLFQQRFRRNAFLELFDGADPNATTAGRSSATSPLQALFSMNSGLAHGAADKFAVRVGMAEGSDDARIRLAYELAFGRPADRDELRAGRDFLKQIGSELARAGTASEDIGRASLASYARALLASNEFVFVD